MRGFDEIKLMVVVVCFCIVTGSPREYLEHYVFPVLLPAMEEMLRQAKTEKCFEVSFYFVAGLSAGVLAKVLKAVA
jgi:hypothetical protein